MADHAERRRLARELHAGPQQQLSAALIQLQLGEHAEAAAQLRDGLAALRDLAADLYPSTLAAHGLASALGALADRLGVELVIDDRLGGERFAEAEEAAAYFEAAEVVRAGATRIVLDRVDGRPVAGIG